MASAGARSHPLLLDPVASRPWFRKDRLANGRPPISTLGGPCGRAGRRKGNPSYIGISTIMTSMLAKSQECAPPSLQTAVELTATPRMWP